MSVLQLILLRPLPFDFHGIYYIISSSWLSSLFFVVQYVELKNKLAVRNGYTDYGRQLREKYEDPEFEADVLNLYEEMKPLYLQLHAYVRRKLFETYGPDVVNLNGMSLTLL